MEDGSIYNFYFSIRLRMADWGELVGYMEFRTEFPELVIVELSSVVCYDCVRYAEPVDDEFQHEVFHLLFSDLGQWLSLHPLRKIFHSDHEEFLLSTCWGKRTEYVHSPLGKCPWSRDRSEVGWRLSLDVCISLAFVTSSNKFLSILVHGQPVISLSEYFVG